MSRLTAVTVVVPEYDSAIGFFVKKLGFDLLEDTDLGEGKRWVKVSPSGGGVALLLAKSADDRQARSVGNQTGGRVFLFLETDDFDGDYDRYRMNGVSFLERPRDEPYGKVAVFQDPFGNKWDLLEAKS